MEITISEINLLLKELMVLLENGIATKGEADKFMERARYLYNIIDRDDPRHEILRASLVEFPTKLTWNPIGIENA